MTSSPSRMLRRSDREGEVLDRLASVLTSIRTRWRTNQAVTTRSPAPTPPAEPSLRDRARELYRQRRLRDEFFADRRFLLDPAWDILLWLFIAHEEDERVIEADIRISGLLATATDRWFRALEQEGLVRRWSEPEDPAIRYVALTESAVETMLRYVSAL